MRYFCVLMLLAWTVGSAEVLFVADQQQSAGGLKGTKPREQPLADIPKEFGFLFHSEEQRNREAAQRATYWEDRRRAGHPRRRGGAPAPVVEIASTKGRS